MSEGFRHWPAFVDPSVGVTKPPSHCMQAVAPPTEMYFPIAQLEQEACAAEENLPGKHWEQLPRKPAKGEKDPGVQGRQ